MRAAFPLLWGAHSLAQVHLLVVTFDNDQFESREDGTYTGPEGGKDGLGFGDQSAKEFEKACQRVSRGSWQPTREEKTHLLTAVRRGAWCPGGGAEKGTLLSVGRANADGLSHARGGSFRGVRRGDAGFGEPSAAYIAVIQNVDATAQLRASLGLQVTAAHLLAAPGGVVRGTTFFRSVEELQAALDRPSGLLQILAESEIVSSNLYQDGEGLYGLMQRPSRWDGQHWVYKLGMGAAVMRMLQREAEWTDEARSSARSPLLALTQRLQLAHSCNAGRAHWCALAATARAEKAAADAAELEAAAAHELTHLFSVHRLG